MVDRSRLGLPFIYADALSNVILKHAFDVFHGDGQFGEFDCADRITFGVEVGF